MSDITSEYPDTDEVDDEELTNEDCPENCTGDEHGAPEPDSEGRWECPNTGTVFRCYGDARRRYNGDLEWELDRYSEGSTNVGGTWYTDPYEYYFRCASCEEWVGNDYVRYSARTEESYCEDCYSEHDNEGSEPDSNRYARCSNCHHGLVGVDIYFDTTTELTYCVGHEPAAKHMHLVAA